MKITEKGAGYCIRLKGNQSNLHEDVKLYFERLPAEQSLTTVEKDHRRLEEREYSLETDIGWLSQKADWAGLEAVGAVKFTALENGASRTETRYFITSLKDVKRFAEAARGHWTIENQLHTFGEDAARVRNDNAPLNWNIMRKAAIPLLRNANLGKKTSIKRKMFMAALDTDNLEKILFQKQ